MSCLVNSEAILLVDVCEGVSSNLEPILYGFVVGVQVLDLSNSLLGIIVVDLGI